MKKLLVIILVSTFIFLSCDNDDMEEETGPFSLIGTWEASGEFVVNGDQRTYKSTLIFLNETDYKQETEYKSKNGTWNLTSKNDGTYVYNDNTITYTDTYYYANGSKGGTYVYTKPYKFINKNTLETHGQGVDTEYITGIIYNRKK
jgi:hypothetical protein